MSRQQPRPSSPRRSDSQENRLAILRATRDVCGTDGDSFSVKQVADHARLSVATLYRHFEGKQALMDAVSLSRWRHLFSLTQTPAVGATQIISVLDAYSQMCSADADFLLALNLRPGYGELAENVRVYFDPAFDEQWRRAQKLGQIRPNVESVDVVNLTSSIQDMQRRRQMLNILLAGVVTSDVQAKIPLENLTHRAKRESEGNLFSLT